MVCRERPYLESATPTRPEIICSSAESPPTKSCDPATRIPVNLATSMPLVICNVCAATMALIVSATDELVITAALAAAVRRLVAAAPLTPAWLMVKAADVS